MANIRTARRSGLVLRGGKQRRETLWAFITPTLTSMAASGGIITGTMNAALLALRPFTIVRTRGYLFLESDQAAAAELQVAAYAGAVVTEQALAIGVTAVPTPITDMGSDEFFLHQIIMADESALTDVAKPGVGVQFDSRAMRKVSESEELYFVAELSSIGSGLTIISAGRFLLKLH